MSLNEVKISAKAMYLVFTDLFTPNDIRTDYARALSNLVSGLPNDVSEDDKDISYIEELLFRIKSYIGKSLSSMHSSADQNLCIQVVNDFITSFYACDIFKVMLHHYVYDSRADMQTIDVYATNKHDALWQVARRIASDGRRDNEISIKNLNLVPLLRRKNWSPDTEEQ